MRNWNNYKSNSQTGCHKLFFCSIDETEKVRGSMKWKRIKPDQTESSDKYIIVFVHPTYFQIHRV